MKSMASLGLAAVVAMLLAVAAPRAEAQVAVGVNIGPAPICPYGYFDYAPYACAPYGYYGPEWFAGGVFIGAGPWYRGPAHFRGHVDNRFDARGGYHGPYPQHGEAPAPHPGGSFHGNEMRDGRGNVVH
ncbi:hypothetical protein ACFFJT_00575 [Dyella flava]|uniref:Uncharacterized protein n=1 Tax=Dyella flava TaxID=1920170 RepID=A0ABS2K2J7_9GAMM|nr:hypothetical protein [Dyella flava]MBM7124885.1 hypothetical protein [Dyella flava]GLQ49838.1 hypothetical protein GCM10010872_12870 [Dyella flava]